MRREIPKPELEEKEQAALHHVTSCLFNRLEVRQVMEKVVSEVCGALRVPPPDKKKAKKKGAKDENEGAPNVQERAQKKGPVDGAEAEKAPTKERIDKKDESKDEDRKLKPQMSREEDTEESEDEGAGEALINDDMDTDAEEQAFAKYESLLAGSSEDSDADSESESDHIQKGKRRSIRVRDMSISLSPEPESASSSPFASASDLPSQSESEAQSEPEPESESESESEADEPPSKQAKLSKAKRTKVPDQTFLPTLMGGYVSGSDSEASEVDVAPRKNRLGQKQRQAIWEKKFGAQARHVQQQQNQRQQRKGGGQKDGWDLRRGAVDNEAGGRKPWKKGIQGPLAAMGKPPATGANEEVRRPKKDDEGTLHPSWEARKKAKEKEQQQPRRINMRPAAGNKIVFDD